MDFIRDNWDNFFMKSHNFRVLGSFFERESILRVEIINRARFKRFRLIKRTLRVVVSIQWHTFVNP